MPVCFSFDRNFSCPWQSWLATGGRDHGACTASAMWLRRPFLFFKLISTGCLMAWWRQAAHWEPTTLNFLQHPPLGGDLPRGVYDARFPLITANDDAYQNPISRLYLESKRRSGLSIVSSSGRNRRLYAPAPCGEQDLVYYPTSSKKPWPETKFQPQFCLNVTHVAHGKQMPLFSWTPVFHK